MLGQTIRGSIRLGVLLTSAAVIVQAKDDPGNGAAVTVSVYDDAKLGLETLLRAEVVATQVFQRAGVEVHWLNCIVGGKPTHPKGPCGKASYPTNLQIRIVKRSRNLRPTTLGLSYLSEEGIGCYSEAFVEPIEALGKVFGVETRTLLGDVVAHELAHLLLGTNSHSATGIMRAHWQREELRAASQGSLHFGAGEAEIMAQHLGRGRTGEGTLVAVGRVSTW
jgi:hypothetical protein